MRITRNQMDVELHADACECGYCNPVSIASWKEFLVLLVEVAMFAAVLGACVLFLFAQVSVQ